MPEPTVRDFADPYPSPHPPSVCRIAIHMMQKPTHPCAWAASGVVSRATYRKTTMVSTQCACQGCTRHPAPPHHHSAPLQAVARPGHRYCYAKALLCCQGGTPTSVRPCSSRWGGVILWLIQTGPDLKCGSSPSTWPRLSAVSENPPVVLGWFGTVAR